MKTHPMVKRIGALAFAALAALAGGMVLSFSGTALAAGTPTSTATPRPGIAKSGKTSTIVDALKQTCEAGIDKRLASLGELQGKVSSGTYLTAGSKATLLREIGAENDGLGALRVKVAGDTDRPTLVADCKSIVEHYRVYLLMIPKAHLMIASDAAAAIGQKLSDLAARLQADIEKATAAGKDTAVAQRDLHNLNAAVSAGTAGAAPVDGLVNFTLPLNPSEYPADEQSVKTARTDIGAAHTNFVQARSDARQVVADLNALRTPRPVTATATG
ncbi:MAG: hypothetical protein QOJ93_2783 [Actinomycetota bacterium]|nr:hypothetical protein [Actinomycetota bacterium]